eukprot:TRINITY_DN3796_c0_g1_i2.p1 TRINITY_DN3796_c0_g1~~TRINITY_DN3796_c0_g1_i2.p1  ORF type:complete len:405 (+),score=113.43 TRINITY_DN3796_c0_g1_i2:57-1217(+)
MEALYADVANLDTTSMTFATVNPEPLDERLPPVQGPDFNEKVDLEKLLSSYLNMGFQGTALGLAVEEINKMIKWRLSDEPIPDGEADMYKDPEYRANLRCKIFLGYTSNMISSGAREIIKFLCEHHMVDVIVTTCGGIEEDFIKIKHTSRVSRYDLDGKTLRLKGINRIGNLVVANDGYTWFEDWLLPILDQMLLEQKENGVIWSPSKMIRRMGKEIDDPNSVYYWCYKNNIPVFCPALTDGAVGDVMYLHSFKNPGLVCDIIQDIRYMNTEAAFAKRSGVIILGGGVVKHHIMNANLMRNGADYSVYVNTGQPFDGSDSGATPDEAVSWGKIKIDAEPVKVYAEATLILPLLVSQTFAKNWVPKDLEKERKKFQEAKEDLFELTP